MAHTTHPALNQQVALAAAVTEQTVIRLLVVQQERLIPEVVGVVEATQETKQDMPVDREWLSSKSPTL